MKLHEIMVLLSTTICRSQSTVQWSP